MEAKIGSDAERCFEGCLLTYLNACDKYARARYSIEPADVGLDEATLAAAQEGRWSPEKLIDHYAEKYNLRPIPSMRYARTQGQGMGM
jgi:hypothetical protein